MEDADDGCVPLGAAAATATGTASSSIDGLNLFFDADHFDELVAGSAGNAWLPAYGLHQPHTFLDRDDFANNPGDAQLFLQTGSHYVYLETIQEETSDDLRSDSDISGSRAPSPAGWLATDSESGSVIRMQTLDDGECESDREVACPAKRRRQEHACSDDESSISRSSSLLQFECLEKQCQEISSSSPSIFSNFSYDSLERKAQADLGRSVSPDSLERGAHSDEEASSEYYKTLKIDLLPASTTTSAKSKKRQSRDSLLYDNSSTSSDDSAETLEAARYDSTRSVNLKTWRSFDALHASPMKTAPVKISAENLSEDSGYSDHFCKCKSSSIPNMVVQQQLEAGTKERNIYKTRVEIRHADGDDALERYRLKNVASDAFDAYDGDVFHTFTGNFGVSYHDLSTIHVQQQHEYESLEHHHHHRSPLIERFMRNGALKRRSLATPSPPTRADMMGRLNLDGASPPSPQECVPGKFSASSSASEPNLAARDSRAPVRASFAGASASCTVSSVPSGLNLAGAAGHATASIAAVNCDLADLAMPKLSRYQRAEYGDKITIRLKYDTSSISSASSVEATPSFKREGSYLEAMAHSIDMSDDEGRLQSRRFDRTSALKAISETSMQSIDDLHAAASTMTSPTPPTTSLSTPNLVHVGKSALVTRSTSTMEVIPDGPSAAPLPTSKSLSGSAKGVHFAPIIAEVSWRDDSISTEREVSSSCSSTPEREVPARRLLTRSQPELHLRQRAIVSSDDSTDDATSLKPAVSEETVRRRPQSAPDACKQRKNAEVGRAPQHQSPPTITSSSRVVEESHKHQQQPQPQSVTRMDAPSAQHAQRRASANELTTKTRAGLGGFFSRIASFRFSSRAAKSDSEKKKQRANNKHAAQQQQVLQVTGQRLATKDDYIYIPLKPPAGAIATEPATKCTSPFSKLQVDGVPHAEPAVVATKPPLPKQPPRVVGACVKRPVAAHAPPGGGSSAPASEPRRTIDSGGRPRPMEPMGLIETDLDTEVTVITNGAHVKTRSLMNLGHEAPTTSSLIAPQLLHLHHHHHHQDAGRPHKSMEFLLDKQNLRVVEPPENELQKGGERVMSEHELRVQRSLQKLNVPDWYKQAQIPREGFLLRSKTPGGGSGIIGGGRESRWQGTGGSKTTSLSSLGSTTQSPVLLSPTTLHAHQPFVRWSTSKLNSTASSPCASTRSSFNARQPNGSISPSSLRSSFNYRQPYLGWRSQERLARPRTPAERLASSILSAAPPPHQPPQESPEIQTSIKEVTSAIVHYVSGLRPDAAAAPTGGREHSYDSQETASQRSRSASPRGSSQKLCWLESSFVGTRPLDSPQTPVTLTESPTPTAPTAAAAAMPVPPTTLRLDLHAHNETNNALSTLGSRRPSPSSTTLEDVLDSLLGLPSSTRAPSPSLQGTASANTSPVRRQGGSEQFRRRSEGSEPASSSRPPTSESRRASVHAPPLLRCRNSRCGRTAAPKSTDAQHFKNCHNCSYTYCSRGCRREHWEKHRKTCLFSRVGSLCRQVIAAAKEQPATLHTLSVIARRGYLSQGQGAVKLFFGCPEAAERFLADGLAGGEPPPNYVRWADLLPSEMGPQLYAELVRMCKSYNPDGRLVLYVSVCVVSEAPAAGAVKWERQLVSRCGRLRLSRNLHVPERDVENLEAVVLTSPPVAGEEARAACFRNAQRHLLQRGVSLKRHYPDVYEQLASFAARRAKFTPVTIYPKDAHTGKPFMCIIMPDVEPQCVEQVTTAGVRVRTVDLLDDELVLENF